MKETIKVSKSSLSISTIVYLSLLLICTISLSAQTFHNTDFTADKILKSNARINPSTLAMELSIPLGSYQGRAGNSIPVAFNYNSKVWQQRHWYDFQYVSGNPGIALVPHFAKNTAAGWTSSIGAPYIVQDTSIYTGPYNGEGYHGQPFNGYGAQLLIKRLNVVLPDGSSHELRASDAYFNVSNTTPDYTGTYLSTDGSKMRVEQGTTETVLYMPDGGKYLLSYASDPMIPHKRATEYTDKHGNRMIYNITNKQWTDTLGRILTNPFPNNPHLQEQTVGEQSVITPGINGGTTQVNISWRYLKDPNGGESGLSNPNQDLAYLSDWFCDSATYQTISGTALFLNGEYGYRICNFGATYPGPKFNPVVMTKITLANGQSYQFKYNTYGEIEKIIYPTGGYERFVYSTIPLIQRSSHPYEIMNRGITGRWVSEKGDGTDEIQWTYSASRYYNNPPQGQTDPYKVTTTNPDGTRTEQLLYDEPDSQTYRPYGFNIARTGRSFEDRVYSAGNPGQLMVRKLTKYIQTGALTVNGDTGLDGATRDLRPEKVVSIIFEPGNNNALVQMMEMVYDTAGNSDPAYFSSLNVKQSKIYKYKVLDSSTALTATVDVIAVMFSGSDVESITEMDYLYDPNYKARNINGLVTETRIKDGAGYTKAKSQITYDEANYLETPTITNALNWINPSTTYRGLPTTKKSWHDVTNAQSFIPTHTSYDQFGNVRKSWDGKGNISEVQYVDNYTDNVNHNSYALPTKTISAIPGGNGSTTAFETTLKYDFNTGLLIKTTDHNGLETRMEYVDPLLRPTKVSVYNGSNQQVGATRITEYGSPDTNGTVPAAQRFIKTKTQIDPTNWKEELVWFDGLGRTVKSQSVDSNGDVFTLTCYDSVGRVSKTSNPFRNISSPGCASTSLEWTINSYDAAGRLWKVTTSDNAVIETNYSLATAGNNLGTVTTVTDQAGKQRRSITNALGQLSRVDEPFENTDSNGNVTSITLGTVASPAQPTYHEYDLLNNLIKVKQGGTVTSPTQLRTFVYDSLSRLKTAENPESGIINYTYDNNGNLLTKTDARNITTTYAYDALNRVTFRNYSDSTPDVIYTYDNLPNAKGKLTKVMNGISSNGVISNPFSITEYQQFDQIGRVTQSQQTTDGSDYPAMTYTYNLSGVLVEQKYPSGRVVKNVLDNDGDLSIVQSRKNQTAGFWNYADNFTYTAAGAISSMQLGNGRWESTQHNSRLQPIQIALGTVQNGTDKLKINFDYGVLNTGNGQVIAGTNNGNIGKQTITVPTEVRGSTTHNGFTATQYYVYDSLNRIKIANENTTPLNQSTYQSWGQAFNYDRYGNRTFDEGKIGNQFLTTTLPRTCGTTEESAICANDKKIYNPQVQTSDNKFSTNDGYQYDSAGNIVRDAQNKKFTYDAENKQTKVETVDSNGNVIATLGEYFYDGDGKRVKKYVPGTGETTVFIYDVSGRLVAENSTLPSSTQTVSYLTTDHLGSPRINTDANGNVTARHDYHPFGEEIQRTSYGADTNRKQFTGYERDKESGLDFAQNRYHNYNLGRFSTPDPLLASAVVGNPQTWNRYSYVLNNPTNFIDPLGLLTECPPDQNCFYNPNNELVYVDSNGNEIIVGDNTNLPAMGRMTPGFAPAEVAPASAAAQTAGATVVRVMVIGVAAGFVILTMPMTAHAPTRVDDKDKEERPGGVAIISLYPKGFIIEGEPLEHRHVSVRVVFNGDTQSSHQVQTSETSTTIASADWLPAAPTTKTVILPNAKAAIEFQRSQMNTPLPTYDPAGNSCVHHVADVLRAGGLNVPSGDTRELNRIIRGLP